MSERRARSGFRGVGQVGLRPLGLSSAREREVRLVRAWARVARGLAARFPARVRRGVLEVTAPDATWERALGSLMTGLAARLAREEPELGLRGWRLEGPGGPGAVTPIDPAAAGPEPPAPGVEPPRGAGDRQAPAGAEDAAEPAEPLEVRLSRLRDRYLERRRPEPPAGPGIPGTGS